MSKPALCIFDTPQTLATAAAAEFAKLATSAVTERGRFSVALSGGSTPKALFALLAAAPYAHSLPWDKIHFFWGDERLVPPDNPGSNYYHANQILLSDVDVPAANVHRALGEGAPQEAVAAYTAELAAFAAADRRWPRFDLALMGLGSDGHTAALFPGPIPPEETSQPVISVSAEYEDRPAHRLSLTPLVFNDARHVLFLATGGGKAKAVSAVLQGSPAPEQWPAQRIQPSDGQTKWFLDPAAAALLK